MMDKNRMVRLLTVIDHRGHTAKVLAALLDLLVQRNLLSGLEVEQIIDDVFDGRA